MAAGLGFKTFTTGEVLTAADTNGYLMQGILVFASSAARAAAITSPQEGQYSYLKDTNALEYYDGAAWVGAPVGDITAVTAGKGLTGGGSSGDVTVSLATTAKGDLVAGSGASTAAVLTVGNNGETLVADSSTSTGLRYTGNYASGKNAVINGAMNVWQRGTSFSSVTAPAYTADRWCIGNASGSSVSRSTDAPTGFAYSLKWDLAGSYPFLATYVELPATGVKGQYTGTWTISFWAKGSTTFSPTFDPGFVDSSSRTNRQAISGGGTVALTTTWTKYSFQLDLTTPTLNAANKAIELGFYLATGANSMYITGVQFEQGSVATAFQTATGTLQGELAACQRYFQKIGGDLAYEAFGQGSAFSSTGAISLRTLLVQMRTVPTLSLSAYGDWEAQLPGVSASTVTNAFLANGYSSTVANLEVAFGSDANFGSSKCCVVRAKNTTAARIYLSAEL